MTSIEGRAGTDRVVELQAEIQRLQGLLAERDRQLAAQRRELSELGRRLDDLLDRESMHVYDPDMERLTTRAAIERLGAPRARRQPVVGAPEAGRTASRCRITGRSSQPRVCPSAPEITAPQIDRGVWEGFQR